MSVRPALLVITMPTFGTTQGIKGVLLSLFPVTFCRSCRIFDQQTNSGGTEVNFSYLSDKSLHAEGLAVLCLGLLADNGVETGLEPAIERFDGREFFVIRPALARSDINNNSSQRLSSLNRELDLLAGGKRIAL